MSLLKPLDLEDIRTVDIDGVLVIAVYYPKGGSGKSFTAKQLSAVFSLRGYSVLLIDLDGTGSVTEAVGLKSAFDEPGGSIFDKLLHPKRVDMNDLIYRVQDGFDFIPSEERMGELSNELVNARNRERRLAKALEDVADKYKIIILDCPPNINLVSDNALVAANGLVMPILPRDEHTRALVQTIRYVNRLQEEMDSAVEILGVVPSQFRGTDNQQKIMDGLRKTLGEMVTPFEIRERDVASELFTAHRSVYSYQPLKRYKREAIRDLQNYFNHLANFILQKVEGKKWTIT